MATLTEWESVGVEQGYSIQGQFQDAYNNDAGHSVILMALST
jgi:hypothetical protein